MAAKKEADSVAVIKEACMADARRIAGEKEDAEEDLAQAKPFLEEAERAVESIKVHSRIVSQRACCLWVCERRRKRVGATYSIRAPMLFRSGAEKQIYSSTRCLVQTNKLFQVSQNFAKAFFS